MKISFAGLDLPKSGAIVLGVGKGNKLSAFGRQVDKASDGAVSRALDVSDFEGKAKQALDTSQRSEGRRMPASRLASIRAYRCSADSLRWSKPLPP